MSAVSLAAAYSAMAALPIERASVSSSEGAANTVSYEPSVSFDGRYVCYTSEASNLVAGDTNSVYDVFVRDVLAGTTERVSVTSSEIQGNSGSRNGDISDDGSVVAFYSNAGNLIDGTPLPGGLIYARNRTAGTTELISQATAGTIPNGSQDEPAISGNGRFVAWSSNADNLIAPFTTVFHIYLRDRQLGTTERISINTGGALANNNCSNPCVSADGRYVAFVSTATNLHSSATAAGRQHVYLRDRTNNTTELIDVDNAGVEAPGHGFDPAINSNGDYVSFTSNANGSAPYVDTSEKIYVRNRVANVTELVSLNPAPGGADGTESSISGDGRYVSYTSDSSNQVAGDTNGFPDVFVRDRFGGVARVCVSATSVAPNNISGHTAMSPDGNHVAFESNASNLTADGNGFATDVFIRDLQQELLPLAPSNLVVTNVAAVPQSRLLLNWTDGSTNEKSFEIERSDGGPWTSIASVGANVVSYTNLNLPADTLFFYRVRALNGAGGSEWTNIDANSTYPTTPLAPANLALNVVSKTRIDLTWIDNSGNEDGFKIERKTGAAGAYAQIATVGANKESFVDSTCAAGTLYYYRIRSFNAPGGIQNSAFTYSPGVTTIPNPPAAPSGLTAVATNSTTVNLTWTDNANNETQLLIERRVGAGAFTQIATRGANQTSYSDTNRTANTSYSYRVRGINAGGVGAYSNVSAVDTLSAPTGLTLAVVSQTRIDLTWADTTSGESGFKIERKTGAGAYTEIATVGANVTTYVNNTGLSAGTLYYYRVRAYKTNSHSTYSVIKGATTLP